MRIIPRKTNVKIEIVKNVTLGDIIFGMIGVAGALGMAAALTSIPVVGSGIALVGGTSVWLMKAIKDKK